MSEIIEAIQTAPLRRHQVEINLISRLPTPFIKSRNQIRRLTMSFNILLRHNKNADNMISSTKPLGFYSKWCCTRDDLNAHTQYVRSTSFCYILLYLNLCSRSLLIKQTFCGIVVNTFLLILSCLEYLNKLLTSIFVVKFAVVFETIKVAFKTSLPQKNVLFWLIGKQ
jgi:hypothetical protein